MLPGQLFYSWVVGPIGSGKTTSLFFKLAYMAKLQQPGSDGIRHTRAVVVRNTLPQLKDTTLASWALWFKDGEAGKWEATNYKFILRFDDVECEVLFRPLDTADDIARVLSLEISFAIIDEFVQVPRAIVDALSGRLGRYPATKDGGCTNWGMWGSSNTDTEDTWWYEYLHDPTICSKGTIEEDKLAYSLTTETIARYYKQPSGRSLDAENLPNLPGGAGYYQNQAKGKSAAWIKQFIDAEWGFSASGQPVVPSFSAQMHLARPKTLLFNPLIDLAVGLDPGLGGSALVLGQEDLFGRLIVLDELVQENMGVERLIGERLFPLLRTRYKDARVVIAPDPAAASRTQTDERTVVEMFRKHFDVVVETNNRLPLRLEAIEYYANKLVPATASHFSVPTTSAGLLIDEERCPRLVRALKGGWRYAVDTKRAVVKGVAPEKNEYSHVGDAFGYLARYQHALYEKTARRKLMPIGNKAIVRRPVYHMR